MLRYAGASAADLSKATQHLPAFFKAGVPSITTLGDAAETAGPKLVASDPVVVDIKDLTDNAKAPAKDLGALLSTFDETGAARIECVRGSGGSGC